MKRRPDDNLDVIDTFLKNKVKTKMLESIYLG
jgi:hypothetical protein